MRLVLKSNPRASPVIGLKAYTTPPSQFVKFLEALVQVGLDLKQRILPNSSLCLGLPSLE